MIFSPLSSCIVFELLEAFDKCFQLGYHSDAKTPLPFVHHLEIEVHILGPTETS